MQTITRKCSNPDCTKEVKITPAEQLLFQALSSKGFKCEQQCCDAAKHIDISIPLALLDIEVDGIHHSKWWHMHKDLDRSFWSCKDDFDTLHLPNNWILKTDGTVCEGFEALVDGLIKLVKVRWLKETFDLPFKDFDNALIQLRKCDGKDCQELNELERLSKEIKAKVIEYKRKFDLFYPEGF